MKLEKGMIQIDAEELAMNDDCLQAFAKHAAFNRTLFDGIVQLLLTDEAQWDKDGIDAPWYTVVSFGKSDFESSRALLIAKAGDAAQTQVRLYKVERDNYEKYYREYLEKSVALENRVRNLENDNRELREILRTAGSRP